MRVVEIIRHPTDAQRGALVEFVESAGRRIGARPLSDHLWLDLRSGTADRFVAVTVAEDAGLIGLAQISVANDTSSLETFTLPDVVDGERVRHDIVETALDAFAAAGGGRVFWWVDDPTACDRSFASERGFEPVRGLHELRRPLPLDRHATIETRPFEIGRDEADWLRVNNRAFAAHGEQGGWTAETLAQRIDEPWFDADGFRIHELDGRMAAFCWTKIDRDLDPPVGEIYVIAVDPDFHGRGLGRELTLAGLDAITERDIRTANLYVDADNDAAIGLYESLGFTIHRSRQAYAGDF
ncbi:MAG: mycothiol synthase [Ilumatobacteraceae bacterium]